MTSIPALQPLGQEVSAEVHIAVLLPVASILPRQIPAAESIETFIVNSACITEFAALHAPAELEEREACHRSLVALARISQLSFELAPHHLSSAFAEVIWLYGQQWLAWHRWADGDDLEQDCSFEHGLAMFASDQIYAEADSSLREGSGHQAC